MRTCAISSVWMLLLLIKGIQASAPDFTQAPPPSFQASTSPLSGVTPRIIVKTTGPEDSIPGQVSAVSTKMQLSVLDIEPDQDAVQAMEAVSSLPFVEYAANDDIVWAIGRPDDPEYRFQWGLPRVKAPVAWNIYSRAVKTGLIKKQEKHVTICVTDSGIDASHPDLQANLHPLIGYNAIDKSSNPNDGLSHGTHIAGIIGATYNNTKNIAGIGLHNVEILSCKFLTDQGYGFTSDAIACVDYCLSMDADIITNSWAGGASNTALLNAIKAAADQDVLFIVAAGNMGTDMEVNATYPASYTKDVPNMIVVTSTGYDDELSDFSNFGSETVHLGAPGEWILSTIPQNSTAYYSGTSMAAPLVAGAAGFLLSASNNELSAAELKRLILENVEPVESLKNTTTTGGILRLDLALQALLDSDQQPVVQLKEKSSRRMLHV